MNGDYDESQAEREALEGFADSLEHTLDALPEESRWRRSLEWQFRVFRGGGFARGSFSRARRAPEPVEPYDPPPGPLTPTEAIRDLDRLEWVEVDGEWRLR